MDYEEALIKSVNKYFPDFRKIGCYYHFKQALYRIVQKYKLTGKKDNEQTLKLINKYLGKLPFAKIENVNTFEKYFNEIYKKFGDKYSDYLNYFYNEWKNFFLSIKCFIIIIKIKV